MSVDGESQLLDSALCCRYPSLPRRAFLAATLFVLLSPAAAYCIPAGFVKKSRRVDILL